jgi:uncharacterized protein YhdP
MRWLLRIRIFIIISLAVTLISAAVIFSVLRALLPYATGYKHEIQQEVSQQIGLPVEIESIDAAIHWFSPRLKLIGVSVYDEKNKVPLFNFKEAFVELDVIASIMHGDLIVADVGLVGADISIERISENEWLVQGIRITDEGSSELPEQFVYMLQNSDFLLHDSNIYYQDHLKEKLNLSLLDINMDVSNSFNNHKIKFSMNLPEEYGKSLAIVADLQGELDSLEGEVYVEAQEVKVNQWNRKFELLQEYELDTVLDVNLWGTVDDNTIQSLIAQLVAKNLSITNSATARHWETPYLSTNFRYVKNDDNWNLAVSDFYFGTQAEAQWGRPVTVLASDDDEYYYLSADFLRLHDLLEISEAVLTPDLKKKVGDIYEEISSYNLKADVYNLDLQIPRDIWLDELFDKLKLQASISDLSIFDGDNNIKLTGIDASVQAVDSRVTVDLETKDAEVELEELLRNPIKAGIIQGRLTADHRYGCWQVKSDRLQLKNQHINSFSRFNIKISSESDVFIDAQTDFYDAYGKYAMLYLPVGIMHPSLINWLDMAVTDGYVPDGTLILHGDPGAFPFKNQDGVLQVLFTAQDVNMKFLDGWPLLEDASGTVKFNNQSLIVTDAKGKARNVDLLNGYAEILDLTKAHLTVKTDANAANEELQEYVWNSPINKVLGDTLRLFQFEGDSDLRLTIDVPLSEEHVDAVIDGHLNFINTQIYYPALGYELSGINGVVDFTGDSVFAESVVARINDKPVTISANTENSDAGRQVAFHLEGVIGIDYLLQRYDWLPENWLSGQSDWSIDIEVPNKPEDYLVHVKANSNLENVVINMSDMVKKPGSQKLDFSADIKVLDNSYLRLNATLGKEVAADNNEVKIVDLFAVRDGKKLWNFDLKSGYMTGRGSLTEGLDKDTVLKLDLNEVDVYSLFVSKNNNESSPLNPSDFPPLEWTAKKVIWDDWVFTDVEVKTGWHKHGMLINKLSMKGPAMTFDARGTWLTSWNSAHETVLDGTITGSDCGKTLVGLGYERSLDHCQYNATFNSRWPAEPYRLSWANMEGKSSFELKDGEILDVDPGAGGRLLGLLNIFKLANRLAFDFDDVTRKGFAFDLIKGDFEFANGDGSLKNFDVTAPAADINMFGRIGMVKHDYGLLMRVKPHTDTLTFAGGTLLGGVVVGAGLALIQKVFDLGVIGHNVYSITGTWDEPIIEKIVERYPTDDADDEDFE